MALPSRELAIVLHAHLPWVREAGALEERWLFEAVIESYLPLVEVCESLGRDGVPGSFVLSLSPTLVAMLRDGELCARLEAHLATLTDLVAALPARAPAALLPALAHHAARLARARATWARCDRDLPGAFARLRDQGRLSLWTCAYPHPLLPLWNDHPWFVDLALDRAISLHGRVFGSPPAGFWLPECGYYPGLDAHLARHGVRVSVLETHGVLHGTPRVPRGVGRPVRSPAGVVFAGRDPHAATEVWSREVGYPGDPVYQDFGRDLGLGPQPGFEDAAKAALRTGLRCWAVTDRRGGEKRAYDPGAAGGRVVAHAEGFVEARVRALDGERAGLSVAPFDAELFGHWWAEGPAFLEAVVRACARRGDLRCVALDASAAVHAPSLETVQPALSTWGQGGYLARWLEGEGSALGRALDRMARALPTRAAPSAALEELLAASASDWPFLLNGGGAPHYARRRFDAHHAGFWRALGRELARPAPFAREPMAPPKPHRGS